MRSITRSSHCTRASVLAGAVLLAACTPPDKPEEERRPEPRSQAAAESARSSTPRSADAGSGVA